MAEKLTVLAEFELTWGGMDMLEEFLKEQEMTIASRNIEPSWIGRRLGIPVQPEKANEAGQQRTLFPRPK
jgi:hypothetical protein